MPLISFDEPCHFFTTVTHDRLPVFRSDKLKEVLAKALDEARTSSAIKIFAYGLMPDHYHIVTDNHLKPSEALRYLNGISARKVIDHLKRNGFESSLEKLKRDVPSKKGHTYSLWQPHPNKFRITNESTLMQKVNYIHLNPVEDELVEHPNDYLYSSARIWNGRALDEEPFEVDIKDLQWRR